MASSAVKKFSAGDGAYQELVPRLLFLLLALVVFRIGSYIPVPGINPEALQHLFNQKDDGFLQMFNMFSGGALGRFSLFALGVMPYISSSIIMQLLTTVLPSLEALKKEGQSGQKKINQYTRYGTVALAFFQGIGISKMLATQSGLVLNPGMSFYVTASLSLVAGTIFLMWLGEKITTYGIGNGISMIIFSGIVARLPSAAIDTIKLMNQGSITGVKLALVLVVVLLMVAFVVFMERGQRKIQVNYAARQQGNKLYQGQSSVLPFKINMSGVIPAIFATSIILFPQSIASWFSREPHLHWLSSVSDALHVGSPLYIVAFSAAVIFFSFFYTALQQNPKEIAENLKKQGAFIPGIRPGENSAKYIDFVLTRLTLVGALYVTFICLMPELLVSEAAVPFYFGGTSLLIVVVVVMDFYGQVQSHLMLRQYSGKNTKGVGLLR